MSRFWPRAAYAEDQLYSHAILYTHVLTRAATMGSLLGGGVGSTVFVLRNLNILKPRNPPLTFFANLLRSAGVGGAMTTGVLAFVLPLRMSGKEEIEWQDRSWRLLGNRGQVEVDDWTYTGMALGALGAASRGLGWRSVAGGIGAGSVAGMLCYMGYRHGLRGGKWDEDRNL